VVGKVIEEPLYRLIHRGTTVAELPLDLLLEGVDQVQSPEPASTRPATVSNTRSNPDPAGSAPSSLPDLLLDLLQHPDIASKRWVYEQYDWSVQTRSVLGPGAGDGAVLWLKGTPQALVATMDGNWRWTLVSPYEGALRVVLEAASNLATHGARPLGITDCLNFANPQESPTLQEFEQAIQGIRDAALALNIPVISGNVSFYNQSETRRIPPTPIIGMVGLLEDIKRMPRPAFSEPGNPVYLFGVPKGDLSGSLYLWHYQGTLGRFRESIDPTEAVRTLEALLEAIRRGWIRSAHDISEGGVLVALAEMVIRGVLGVDVRLSDPDLETWVGERPGRWILEVSASKQRTFESWAQEQGIPVLALGQVLPDPVLVLQGHSLPRDLLKDRYEQTFPGFFEQEKPVSG